MHQPLPKEICPVIANVINTTTLPWMHDAPEKREPAYLSGKFSSLTQWRSKIFSGRPRRHMESSSTCKRIYSPNRDIEKIPAPLRSHISSPNLSPSRQDDRQFVAKVRGPGFGCCQSSYTYPCKTLFPTIRPTLLGGDFPCY
ncbi:hypothetical protein AVEN_136979-1 [Araneus ventricosus]|uniref:Uncharacterized protein n=1 Tax=Araneus ventricosus TaxID=182803 RepID=A0A4Y2BIG6_ARAVE|nr:hypothetical protein AVEN_136979-1 [Araneus ventricosus]